MAEFKEFIRYITESIFGAILITCIISIVFILILSAMGIFK